MTRSDLIAIFAGLFLALDGLSIVMSRTSLLDSILAFWALAGFGFLVLDRDFTRKRLAKIVSLRGLDAVCAGMGPSLGWRPYRWLAGISLGLACGVKWSGIWFVAVFAVMAVLWDVGTRKSIGIRHPFWVSVLKSAPPAFIGIVVVAFVTYLATWTGWFVTDGGWGRHWADSQPHTWIPSALLSLWHYHVEAWNFSINLTADHSYQSNPLSWMFQVRPVSFYYESFPNGAGSCTGSNCAAEVLAVGNPVLWWGGCFALLHQLWRWIAWRDWRSGALLRLGFVVAHPRPHDLFVLCGGLRSIRGDSTGDVVRFDPWARQGDFTSTTLGLSGSRLDLAAHCDCGVVVVSDLDR
jgi:dolichyl-phosphate-mannose--protein O-mannosyl transferase